MNISTNYNVINSYSNLRMNEQQKASNITAPSFKMTNKMVNRGLVSAALAGAYLGAKTMVEPKAEQVVTLEKVKEYIKDRTNFDNAKGTAGFISNLYITRCQDEKAYIDRINKFLNDPKELGYAEGYMSRGFGLWRCFVD